MAASIMRKAAVSAGVSGLKRLDKSRIERIQLECKNAEDRPLFPVEDQQQEVVVVKQQGVDEEDTPMIGALVEGE